MGKKETKGLCPKEEHTYRELCENLFEIKVEISEYMHSPLTQTIIDEFPQMVRLANEQKILDLRLKPKITETFRLQAEQNKSLETKIGEGSYYRALEGSVPIKDFFRLKAK